MKCSDARFALAANPGDDDAGLAAHLDACPACAEYATEMLDLDRRLLKALQVDVPAVVQQGPLGDPTVVQQVPLGDSTIARQAALVDPSVAPLRPAMPLAAPAAVAPQVPAPRTRRGAFRSPMLALAASVAGAAVLLAMLWSAFPRETLAAAVVDHMAHEPEAWGAAAPIPASAVAYALSRTGVRLDADFTDVTYANTCWFRGRGVPHLVVRTDSGLVTIMVLPHESVSRRVPFDEGGYRGVLVPAARGSIAVLAREATAVRDTDVDAAAARAVEAIRYVD
jgi:hypothetical protein